MKHSLPRLAALLAATLPLALAARADDDAPVASIGSTVITRQALGERTAAQSAEQEKELERDRHRLEVNAKREHQALLEGGLSTMLDERVLGLEAQARKSTPEALKAALKPAPVSDAQVHSFYDSNRGRIEQPFEQVNGAIRQYLEKQNRETVERSYLDGLRTKYKAVSLLPPLREDVPAEGPRRGPADARVTMVEFSDFQCPYCGRFVPTVHEIMKKYPTQLRLIYRHLPLTAIHPFAQKAAEAAVCAERQGKFWEMHDLLFAEQSSLDVPGLKQKAGRIGLDTAAFDACLDGGQAQGAVAADVAAAQQLGLNGTPASFIDGRFVNGAASAEDLSRIIDDELSRPRPAGK